jgi:hypothetical protein
MKKTIQQIELYSGEKLSWWQSFLEEWCNMQVLVILLIVLNSLKMAFTISLFIFFIAKKEKKENHLRDS